ncbi:MAG: sugar kinase [Bacteroidetes bacterium]|nr:sugar kinase [Bacteroidota bacterium]
MVELYATAPLPEATVFHRSFGGDSLNTLVAASRLGSSTGYITKVGDDPFAPGLLNGWQLERVDTSRVQVVPGYNGVYFVSVIPGGQREFTYYRSGSAASTLTPHDLDQSYIATSTILHVTGISQAISPSCRGAVLMACQMAKEAGVIVSYDLNLRPSLWPSLEDARSALEEIMPYLDIVFASTPDDTRGLIRLSEPEEVIHHFWDKGVKVVAVKTGGDGCAVGEASSGGMVTIPAPAVKVVDTTGAGDAFNGAFLHGIATGMDTVSAAALAVVTASLKVRGRGAVASLPSSDEVHPLWEKHLSTVRRSST